MRILHSLLMCFTITAATLFAGSPVASAAPVEVVNSVGEHCGTAAAGTHSASGGCVRHALGTEVNLIQHINGVPTLRASCSSEFKLNISESGEAWITDQVLTAVHPGIPCGPQPCAESGGGKKPWHASVLEPRAGVEHAVIQAFCLTAQIAPNVFCHLAGAIEVDIVGGPPYSLEAESKSWTIEGNVAEPAAAQPNCNGFAGLGPFEIDGHWTLELQNILLIH